jgi:hypothetical protein
LFVSGVLAAMLPGVYVHNGGLDSFGFNLALALSFANPVAIGWLAGWGVGVCGKAAIKNTTAVWSGVFVAHPQGSDDSRRMRRATRIVLASFAGLLLVATAAFLSLLYLGTRPEPSYRAQLTYRFTATPSHFIFGHASRKTGGLLVAYDHERHETIAYRTQGGSLGSPSASREGNAFYMNSLKGIPAPGDVGTGIKGQSTVYRCLPETHECDAVFQYNGLVGDIVDFPDGDIIFVGVTPEILGVSPKQFVRYRLFDFYRRRPDSNIDRLTDWNAFTLQSVGLGRDKLVFQLDPRWRLGNSKSEIYTALLSPERRITPFVPSDSEPFAQPSIAYGRNKDVAPSVSPDGSKTAFQSSSESREGGRWRYDIVIVDSDSKKSLYTIVPEPDAVLSPPKFIDANRLRFMSFDGQRYKFWEFDVSTGKKDLLGELISDDIQRATVYDLPKEAP